MPGVGHAGKRSRFGVSSTDAGWMVPFVQEKKRRLSRGRLGCYIVGIGMGQTGLGERAERSCALIIVVIDEDSLGGCAARPLHDPGPGEEATNEAGDTGAGDCWGSAGGGACSVQAVGVVQRGRGH